MWNELIDQLTLEELTGEARDLAELIGMDAFRRLLRVYGGTGLVYIPKPSKLLKGVRDAKIREEYNGSNLYALCRRWGLSEAYVRKIVADKIKELRRSPLDGQMSLYEDLH